MNTPMHYEYAWSFYESLKQISTEIRTIEDRSKGIKAIKTGDYLINKNLQACEDGKITRNEVDELERRMEEVIETIQGAPKDPEYYDFKKRELENVGKDNLMARILLCESALVETIRNISFFYQYTTTMEMLHTASIKAKWESVTYDDIKMMSKAIRQNMDILVEWSEKMGDR